MLSAQLNLLDSHDVNRFLTLCGGDRARMEQAVLFQMAFPGMPCVFYGDEKGLEGTLENEYRRPMAFDRSDALEDVYRRMIALRKEHPALRHGDFQTLLARERLFVCRRSAPEESLLLCWNAGEKASPVPGLSEEAVPLLQKGWNGGLLEGAWIRGLSNGKTVTSRLFSRRSERSPMAITIYDLAKEAHVSIATVSKALNNSYTISDKTRERIQTLARQMNYQPNARARSFARQKNGTVLFAADLAPGSGV